MNTTYRIQMGKRGVITFPKELRDAKNIAEGEILNLIELLVAEKNHMKVKWPPPASRSSSNQRWPGSWRMPPAF